MTTISVNHLTKSFKYHKKEVGFRNSVKNLFNGKSYTKTAVNDISFSIEEGEIVGFLGPNGAGKTTTLKMLSGIMHPTSGDVSILNCVPWQRKNEFKRQISIVLGQKNQLWWDLPASESLYLNKCMYKIDDAEYSRTLDELCELLQVKDLLDVQVRNLSLGERMKMELIAALLHKPKVIFLDEPTIGLDMIAQKNIREFLKFYNKKEKTTIMLTSHYLEDIEDLCKRTIVINHGRIVYDGNIKSINEKLEQKKIVTFQFAKDKDAAIFEKHNLIRNKEDGAIVLEVEKNEMQEVISKVFEKYEIHDFSVENIPLEESLEKLYR